MSEFQREERYIVVKLKDLDDEQIDELRGNLVGIRTRECVVVEPDWPIYEIVWHLVERVATGQRLPFMTDEDPDKIRAERDKAEQRAERNLGAFHILCESLTRLEEIVGIDTGGWNGAAPALNAVEQIKRERDALAAPNRDMVAHMQRQIAFSTRVFGPGDRQAGVIDHIRKELHEIEEAPHDLEEWIDVVLLALDGAWRSGHTAEQVVAMLDAKLAKNENREWPDWRTADRTKAIEHNRQSEEA